MPRPQNIPRKKGDLKKNAGTLRRLFGFLFKNYPVQLIVVALCIVTTVIANTRGTLFMQTLIDDYILPMIGTKDPDYGPLAGAIFTMVLIYGVGICASLAQNLIMARVTQGTLDKLRRAMFDHMQDLPIQRQFLPALRTQEIFFPEQGRQGFPFLLLITVDTSHRWVLASFKVLIASVTAGS